MTAIFLQYLGCSAFVLSDGAGSALALDLWTKGAFPYAEDTPEELRLGEPPALSALLVSHDHKDHCFVPAGVPVIYGVQSDKVDDQPAFELVGNIGIGKFASQHFPSSGKLSKANTVFVLTIAGLKVVHLGDAHGTMAEPAALRALKDKLGELDVLLMPVGSPWLKPVKTDILDNTITILAPRVTIPMHYWTLADKAKVLSSLSDLGYASVDMQKNAVELSAASLPDRASKTIWNIPAGEFQPVDIV